MRLNTVGLIVMLALGIVAVPLAADAQQATKVYRIGRLVFDRADSQRGQYYREVFRQGLREFGWVEGQNITIEWRSAEERVERFPDLAAELVRLQVDDIVVSGGGQMLRTIKEATTTIPIVITSPDPVGDGLVASLAQPGGNITGVSIMATEGGRKRLELLKEAVPQAAHVAVLWNAANRFKALE